MEKESDENNIYDSENDAIKVNDEEAFEEDVLEIFAKIHKSPKLADSQIANRVALFPLIGIASGTEGVRPEGILHILL